MDITQEWIDRFNAKWIVVDSGCWEWQATKLPKGYGIIKIPKSRKYEYAHRLSYRIHIGDIPDGHYVCHKCDNPSCVNPSHLFAGTCKVNQQDMKAKGRSTLGERNSMHTLTTPDVVKIKAMLQTGKFSQAEIARLFGVGQMTISRIKRGLRWSHI